MLALSALIVRWRDAREGQSSFLWYPSLLVALIPGALLTLDNQHAIRAMVLLVVGAALCVYGSSTRRSAPAVTGAVTTVICAVGLLGPAIVHTFVSLPWWLTAGTIGIVLLTLGIRFEQTNKAVGSLTRWVKELN